jgi:hypothetical protein
MAAAQLQHDHRNWLVMWGCYTHTYIAFPLFHAPRGTVLTAAAPGEMAAKMHRQERSARVPPPTESPEWQDPNVPPQGWPGGQSLPAAPTASQTPAARAGGLPAPLAALSVTDS